MEVAKGLLEKTDDNERRRVCIQLLKDLQFWQAEVFVLHR